jgi:DNA-directed RNA polymerase specialized sigma24 family protein
VTAIPSLVSDSFLLQGLGSGDAAAGAELQRRHSGSLYALAYAIVWDTEDATRLVDRTFTELPAVSSRYDPATHSVYAWLAGLVKEAARMRRATTSGRTATPTRS